MFELYYLDHFREEVAKKKAEGAITAVRKLSPMEMSKRTANVVREAIDVDAAEELMREAKVSMKMMSERTAKLMLDLAFNKITHMSDDAASERLIRYAGELCLKAKFDLDERQEFFATLKDHIEDHIGDD